jgi:hypothetical protein
VTRGVSYAPRIDILETDEELTLFADLPGAKAEDVDIRFENGELRLGQPGGQSDAPSASCSGWSLFYASASWAVAYLSNVI